MSIRPISGVQARCLATTAALAYLSLSASPCYANSGASHGFGTFQIAFFVLSMGFVVGLVAAGYRRKRRALWAFLLTIVYIGAAIADYHLALAICGGGCNNAEFVIALLAYATFFVLGAVGIFAVLVLFVADWNRSMNPDRD